MIQTRWIVLCMPMLLLSCMESNDDTRTIDSEKENKSTLLMSDHDTTLTCGELEQLSPVFKGCQQWQRADDAYSVEHDIDLESANNSIERQFDPTVLMPNYCIDSDDSGDDQNQNLASYIEELNSLLGIDSSEFADSDMEWNDALLAMNLAQYDGPHALKVILLSKIQELLTLKIKLCIDKEIAQGENSVGAKDYCNALFQKPAEYWWNIHEPVTFKIPGNVKYKKTTTVKTYLLKDTPGCQAISFDGTLQNNVDECVFLDDSGNPIVSNGSKCKSIENVAKCLKTGLLFKNTSGKCQEFIQDKYWCFDDFNGFPLLKDSCQYYFEWDEYKDLDKECAGNNIVLSKEKTKITEYVQQDSCKSSFLLEAVCLGGGLYKVPIRYNWYGDAYTCEMDFIGQGFITNGINDESDEEKDLCPKWPGVQLEYPFKGGCEPTCNQDDIDLETVNLDVSTVEIIEGKAQATFCEDEGFPGKTTLYCSGGEVKNLSTPCLTGVCIKGECASCYDTDGGDGIDASGNVQSPNTIGVVKYTSTSGSQYTDQDSCGFLSSYYGIINKPLVYEKSCGYNEQLKTNYAACEKWEVCQENMAEKQIGCVDKGKNYFEPFMYCADIEYATGKTTIFTPKISDDWKYGSYLEYYDVPELNYNSVPSGSELNKDYIESEYKPSRIEYVNKSESIQTKSDGCAYNKSYVNDYFCDKDGFVHMRQLTCPEGTQCTMVDIGIGKIAKCIEVQEEIVLPVCFETDAGNDLNILSTTVVIAGSDISSFIDGCDTKIKYNSENSFGQSSNATLSNGDETDGYVEYFCSSNGGIGESVYYCDINETCISNNNEGDYPFLCKPSCIDTDSDNNPKTYGIVKVLEKKNIGGKWNAVWSNEYADICYYDDDGNAKVKQYACDEKTGDVVALQELSCPSGCNEDLFGGSVCSN